MIRAETADRIMQGYESDYDNFLNKLKAKRKAKKAEAAIKKVQADKADKTVSEAEAHKMVHLGQKAKDLLDKAGGIEGAKDTIQNVLKYVKGDASPADYEVGVGKDPADPTEKKLFGMPPMVVYVGGALLLLIGVYGLSRMKKNSEIKTQAPVPSSIPPATPGANSVTTPSA
jgi:ABC-type enterochelin transport system substrate-binding protein